MFRQLTAIVTVFITSFVFFITPVRAESLPFNFIDLNHLSSIQTTAQEITNSLGEKAENLRDVIDLNQLPSIQLTAQEIANSVGGKAENLRNVIDLNQLPSIQLTAQEIVNSVEGLVETVEGVVEIAGDVFEIVTIGGTTICLVSGIASTSVFPPAAAILPYCSAIGIIDSGNAVTKMVKKPKQAKQAWNKLRRLRLAS